MSRGTTRPLVAIAAVVGLAELGFATVIPLLPLYLKERLGASATLVGVVVAAFAAVETVCKTTWGHVADRIGRRPVVVGGLVLASAAPIVMTVLRVPWLFVPLRLVDGTGSAALWPATAAAIVDRTAANRRATGMGTLNMFFLSGLALGPSLGLFVSGAFGSYRAGFYLASGLLLAAAATRVARARGRARRSGRDPRRPPRHPGAARARGAASSAPCGHRRSSARCSRSRSSR